MDGVLILDKPGGLTSQQALGRLRRAFRANKAGHTGTLDPLATGVLPVALGEATKIIPFLEEGTKVYQVTGRLGASTDTYDSDGEIQEQGDITGIGPEEIRFGLRAFLGKQEQVPPPYSAIKLRGKPLYEYARQGKEVELQARAVHFETLELESAHFSDFTLKVVCSKGTYIRSLIHDLGRKLGCGAHVTALRRLASGPFSLDRAWKLEAVLENPGAALAQAWSIEDLLADWPRLELEGLEEARRVRAGVSLRRLNQVIENNKLFNKNLALIHRRVVQALIRTEEGRDFEYLRVLNREESV